MGLRHLAEASKPAARSSDIISDTFVSRDSNLGRWLLATGVEGRVRMQTTIGTDFGDTFPRERGLADFLRIAMDRICADPKGELNLTVNLVRELMDYGIGVSELETLARSRIEALKKVETPEPITVEAMKAMAEQVGYEEVYDVYRHRKEAAPDRLLDVTDRAQNLTEACAKLIGLAGFDETEAKEHGLDQFDAGTVFELCERLKELTGDSYTFEVYETPAEAEA